MTGATTNKLEKGVYEIMIRGIIGLDVSGIYVAEMIDYFNEQGATRIIERINSAGGDVIDGFNIVSANLRSAAKIETINEGVAASMAAIILASGDDRKAMDYSTALIHDPQTDGETLEAIEDENQKANLLKIKDSLVKILTDACGKSKNVVSNIMSRETVMTAREQKDFGLVDIVVKSRVEKPDVKNLSLTELMNVCKELIPDKSFSKFNKMEKFTHYLKLNADASEDNVLKAVEAISKTAIDNAAKLTTATDQLAQSQADLKISNDKLKSLHDQSVKIAVDNAIDTGKFAAEQRDKLTEQAGKNLEFFNEMVETMPVIHQSVLSQLENKSDKDKDKDKDKKDWDYYQNNDPVFLTNLEISDPVEYGKLFKEYWGEEYQPAK